MYSKKSYRGVEIQIRIYVHRDGFNFKKECGTHLTGELNGPQIWSGRLEEKKLLLSEEFETQIFPTGSLVTY
jgi:hypothetical protein